MEKLTIYTAIQICSTPKRIYNAIIDPGEMENYFLSEGSAVLEQGKRIIWKWPEFPEMQSVIDQISLIPDRRIQFVWDGQTTVTISLEEQPDESTVVTVTEGEKEANAAGLKWYAGNTEGWANFLACLKAYLEYGINLRKGAFEFLRKKDDTP